MDLSNASQKYRELKNKAVEDPHILALRDKADAAVGDEEYAAASRIYYKALFAKIRKLDPSMTDYINRVESATMRGLEKPAGKAKQ